MRLLILLLFLSGCASTPYWKRVDTDWKLTGPIRITRNVPPSWLHKRYLENNPELHGYAYRNPDGSCDVYILSTAENPSCTEAHEIKHCEGWDHPDHKYNLACSNLVILDQWWLR